MARHVEIDIDSDANTKGFVETALAADRAANRLDKLGDEMRGTARDAALLDAKILATKSTIRALGQEYAVSGDKELAGTLANQRGKLANLELIRVEMDRFAKTARDVGDISVVRNIPVVSRVVNDMRGAELAAADLDRQIIRARESVLTLGDAFSRTGSKDVLRALRDQRGTLAALEQIRKDMRDLEDASDKAADKAGKLGDKLRSTSEGAHTLEERIAASKTAVIALGEEFVRTGDKDVFKNLREERGTLRNLQQMSKEMEAFGGAAKSASRDFGDFGNVSGVISSAFKALPTEAKLAVVGAAAAAAPAIVAAISGALLAALSGGTMAVGILASLRTAEVQSAWKEFASGALTSLTDAASSLQGPLIRAAGMFTQALNVDSIRQDFEAVAPMIEQLARGVIGLFQQFQPGFLEGLKGANLAFEALAGVLPELGHDLGQFFSILGSQGAGGASALELTVRLLGTSLVALASIMATCSAAFQLLGGSTLLALDRLGALEPIVLSLIASPILPWLAKLADRGDEVSATWHDANEVTYEAAKAQGVFEQALATGTQMAQQARQAVADLEHQLSSLATQILNGKSADLTFKQGRLDMIDALKKSKGSLDENTTAGIAAEQSMLRQAQNAVAVRDSMLQQKLGVEAADKAYDGLIQQIYNDAAANHVSKEKVDAVIGSLRNIPRPNPIDLELRRIGLTDDDLREYKRSLLGAQGTYTATINTIHREIWERIDAGNIAPGSGGRRIMALGGIVAAAQGMITNSPTVLFGERQTEQEAYIPKRGIGRSRATGLLGTAAGWYGYGLYDRRDSGYSSPVVAGGGRGGGNTYHITNNVAPGASPADVGAATVEAIGAFERLNGSNWRKDP